MTFAFMWIFNNFIQPYLRSTKRCEHYALWKARNQQHLLNAQCYFWFVFRVKHNFLHISDGATSHNKLNMSNINNIQQTKVGLSLIKVAVFFWITNTEKNVPIKLQNPNVICKTNFSEWFQPDSYTSKQCKVTLLYDNHIQCGSGVIQMYLLCLDCWLKIHTFLIRKSKMIQQALVRVFWSC